MPEDTNKLGPRLPDGILLEGIVTTLDADGMPHVAPMGPIVDAGFTRLLLRPFRASTTFSNLQRSGQGVFHITDDVDLFARSAVGKLTELPSVKSTTAVAGVVLADACRWYAFQIESVDDWLERTELVARVLDSGSLRDFIGFNRAKHAVIEAAILATRLPLFEPHHVRHEFERLKTIVEKTGSRREHAAFEFLQTHVSRQTEAAPVREVCWP